MMRISIIALILFVLTACGSGVNKEKQELEREVQELYSAVDHYFINYQMITLNSENWDAQRYNIDSIHMIIINQLSLIKTLDNKGVLKDAIELKELKTNVIDLTTKFNNIKQLKHQLFDESTGFLARSKELKELILSKIPQNRNDLRSKFIELDAECQMNFNTEKMEKQKELCKTILLIYDKNSNVTTLQSSNLMSAMSTYFHTLEKMAKTRELLNKQDSIFIEMNAKKTLIHEKLYVLKNKIIG